MTNNYRMPKRKLDAYHIEIFALFVLIDIQQKEALKAGKQGNVKVNIQHSNRDISKNYNERIIEY